MFLVLAEEAEAIVPIQAILGSCAIRMVDIVLDDQATAKSARLRLWYAELRSKDGRTQDTIRLRSNKGGILARECERVIETKCRVYVSQILQL